MSLQKEKICQPLKVTRLISESKDSVSIVLDIPQDQAKRFAYRSGQFVSFFIDIDGQEVHRSYSLSSAPSIDSDFKITVKRVPGGKMSTYLTEKLKVGDTLWTTPPAGLFVLPEDTTNTHCAFYAAGSGITPIISMIKSLMNKSSTTKCLLVYQNKNTDNVIFANEINELVDRFVGRLKLIQFFSSMSAQLNNGTSGRLESHHVKDLLFEAKLGIQTRHFMCGPDGFMNAVKMGLEKLNVPKDRIHFESFANPIPPNSNKTESILPTNATLIGDQNSVATPETIEALIDGETHIVKVQPKMTVLESLLDAGLQPPYSCLDGACMACMAKVTSGAVYQTDLGILTEDNVEALECLTCQARPASKSVLVDFGAF